MNAHKADHVDSYLRANIHTYDMLLVDAENGKALTEVPIVVAAVGGATAVALGGSTDLAIGAAGVGALGTGLSSWIKPRDRIKHIIQARLATSCILREYTQLIVDAEAASLANYSGNERVYSEGSLAGSYPNASAQVAGAGLTALAASDEVVSKLKLHLSGVGTMPDYAAIVEGLSQRQQQAASALTADANKAKLDKLKSPPSELLVKRITEYGIRVDACAAKIQ